MSTFSVHAALALPLSGDLGTRSRLGHAARRLVQRQPLGAVALVLVLLIVGAAVCAPWLRTSQPTAFGDDILVQPGGTHWFGTNRQGQDLWSRVVYGARPALAIGGGAVAVSVVLGVVLALAAGFGGGLLDLLISRLLEVFISLPAILWAMVLSTSAGDIPGFEQRGVKTLILAISVGFTPVIARILRGNVLQEAQRPYVEAARVLGAGNLRLLFRHILPNLAPLIIVVASATLPGAILAEAGLSFLGLGLAPGEPSWGGDLGGQARTLFRSYWWLPVFPGVALSLTVLAFNLLGDSMRDLLDPRLRGRMP